ncbi:sodium transporter [bacterium]|nr:sodium transporter [bacterium]
MPAWNRTGGLGTRREGPAMIELAIVLAFVAYSVTVGLRARRAASRNLEEYFLAGRTLRGWRAGLSMAATQYAADTPLLVTGLVATAGVFALWRLWIYALAFLLMGYVLGRAWRHAGVITDAEVTEIRYSGRGVLALRALKAVYYGTVVNCVVMAMVLVAAARIAEIFLPWHAWLPAGLFEPVAALVRSVGAPLHSGVTGLDPWVATADNVISLTLIVGFTGLYSVTGGLRGVVATDVVQLVLMLGGTLVYAIYATVEAGGLGGLDDRLGALYGDEAGRALSFLPPPGEIWPAFAVVVGLQWFYQVNSDGTGYLAQRTMGCRTDRDAVQAGVVFTVVQVLVRSLLWLPIAVALLVIYPHAGGQLPPPAAAADRELLFVTGMRDLLPAVPRGVMLTAMLAALASTIDTHLSWGASYWSNDLYGRLVCRAWLKREPGPREQVLVARLATVLVLVLSLAVMTRLDSIQQAWKLSLLCGAGMGAVLVLRWLWERVNLWSEVGAIVTSLVAAPVLLLAVEADWLRLALMALVTTLAVVVAALWAPATDPDTRRAFFVRVRPPGFWTATAREVGLDDPRAPVRELGRGLAKVAGTAIVVFALLVAITRLVLPGP